MTTLREAAQQALEALKCLVETHEMGNTIRADIVDAEEAIASLKAALEQPEQAEPVAYLYHDASTPRDAHPWLHSTMLVLAADRRPGLRGETPLFINQPRREPLTVTELQQALVDTDLVDPDAIDDPEGYDGGVTLEGIDALHKRLTEGQT